MKAGPLALPLALALVAGCGGAGGGNGTGLIGSGAPSARLDPRPAFTEQPPTSDPVSADSSDASLADSADASLADIAAATDDTLGADETEANGLDAQTDAASSDSASEPSATFLPADADATAADVAASSDLPGCPDAPRAAVADKEAQRYWLCSDGAAITDQIPMTTASGNYGLPPVGTYPVFARDEQAWGIGGQALERFVAFYTTPRGNRIAFHEVVDQDPATVGDLDQRGASAGCFRVRESDSVQVWDFLQIDDPVVVIS